MVSTKNAKILLIILLFVFPLMAGFLFPVKGAVISVITSLVTPPVIPTTPPTPTPQSATNIALLKNSTSSSNEKDTLTSNKAVDGSTASRWASAEGSDPQWISIDLGSTFSLSRVKLQWETAYARSYQLQISNDGSVWSPIYNTNNGDGSIDDINVSGTGRYIRMYGTQRATQWGYSLWEFEVYGTATTPVTPTQTPVPTPTSTQSPTSTPTPVPIMCIGQCYGDPYGSSYPVGKTCYGVDSACYVCGANGVFSTSTTACASLPPIPTATLIPTATPTPIPQSEINLALNKPVYSSSDEKNTLFPANVVDGKQNTRWASVEGIDPQWIYVDLGSVIQINRVKLFWETAYGKNYRIEVSNDATNWSTVHADTAADGGLDDVTLNNASGRYVRMYGLSRGTQWGYSLWEFEIYGNSTSYFDLTSPDGGEIIQGGQTYRIKWNSSSNIDKLSIMLLSDLGSASWLAYDIQNIGYYDWNVSYGNPVSNKYEIQIYAYGSGISLTDKSKDFFTLTMPPSPTPTPTSTPTPTPTPFVSENLALNKPTFSSSNEKSSLTPGNATDGNPNTRWASVAGVDPQWMYVDLGSTYTVKRIKLSWETAYGKDYDLQISQDGINWTQIYSRYGFWGGIDDITTINSTGRYIRVLGYTRGTQWGYSLWGFEVYGIPASPLTLTAPNGGEVLHIGDNYRITWNAPSTVTSIYMAFRVGDNSSYNNYIVGSGNGLPNTGYFDWNVNIQNVTNDKVKIVLMGREQNGTFYFDASDNYFTILATPLTLNTTNLALGKPTLSSGNDTPTVGSANAVDGDLNTEWKTSDINNPSWVSTDLGATKLINKIILTWDTPYASAYELYVSEDNITWRRVYDTRNYDGGGVDEIFVIAKARYIKLIATEWASAAGIAVKEFEVY